MAHKHAPLRIHPSRPQTTRLTATQTQAVPNPPPRQFAICGPPHLRTLIRQTTQQIANCHITLTSTRLPSFKSTGSTKKRTFSTIRRQLNPLQKAKSRMRQKPRKRFLAPNRPQIRRHRRMTATTGHLSSRRAPGARSRDARPRTHQHLHNLQMTITRRPVQRR